MTIEASAVHAPGTELAAYAPGQAEEYRPQLAMTPADAKALDDQLRAATRAVLRENTDYGIIPGTGGQQTLYRPGAQKLLQWFGYGFTCDEIRIDTGADGQREGVTYRATVYKRLPGGQHAEVATCEGYAGYDESKFYQSAEQVQRKAEDAERRFAEKDRRPPRPTKWQGLPEYRAPWNTVIKRAQKRAIVGATIDATAAGGVFGQDEEDDTRQPAAAPADNGPSWYEEALEAALTFDTLAAGNQLFTAAAAAARDGQCSPRQATHIQNRIRQRGEVLKTATPVDVEDLGQPAQDAAGDARPDTEMPENEPGSAGKGQLTKLHTQFTKLGFGYDEREQKLAVAEAITGRKPLTGPHEGRTSKNLSWAEAAKLTLDLAVMDSREDLITYMAGHEATDG